MLFQPDLRNSHQYSMKTKTHWKIWKKLSNLVSILPNGFIHEIFHLFLITDVLEYNSKNIQVVDKGTNTPTIVFKKVTHMMKWINIFNNKTLKSNTKGQINYSLCFDIPKTKILWCDWVMDALDISIFFLLASDFQSFGCA